MIRVGDISVRMILGIATMVSDSIDTKLSLMGNALALLLARAATDQAWTLRDE
jgi:hypothetical protein